MSGTATDCTTCTARILDATVEQYFALSDQAVSHSELEVFRESPHLYHGRFITKVWPQEETEATKFGTVFHSWLLEDARDFVTIPTEVLSANGSKAGGKWKEFEAANAGKTLLKAHEVLILKSMRAEIEEHEMANRILFDIRPRGNNEIAVQFTCGHTGIQRRCLIDALRDSVIADVKTTDDAGPKAFSRKAFDFGYHRQAAWYIDAVKALTGDTLPFVFIVCQKSEPYTVNVYRLDDDYIALGRDENESDLRRFSEARRLNVWREESHGQILELKAPKWAYDAKNWML